MVSVLDLCRETGRDVLDYQQVVSLLHDYAKPRDRIGAWLARGDLVRVRKGLYVAGDSYRRAPVVRELLANLIYGPSCISLDYALDYHGLIPERVVDVTSVTTGKARRFETPFGVFSYRPLPPERYAPGITFSGTPAARFLIASPEKALVDKVWCDKRLTAPGEKEVAAYLFEDLRLDEARVRSLDLERLRAIAAAFGSRKINTLVQFIRKLGGTGHA